MWHSATVHRPRWPLPLLGASGSKKKDKELHLGDRHQFQGPKLGESLNETPAPDSATAAAHHSY